MNYFIGCGRLSRDIKANDSGKQAFATIAIDRPYPWNKNRDGDTITDFLELKFMGEKNVNRATQYLTKGTKIIIRATACRDSWKNNDGNFEERNYFIVDDWEFAESKRAAQEYNNGGGNGNSNSNGNNSAPKASVDDFMNVDDSDDDGVPFGF